MLKSCDHWSHKHTNIFWSCYLLNVLMEKLRISLMKTQHTELLKLIERSWNGPIKVLKIFWWSCLFTILNRDAIVPQILLVVLPRWVTIGLDFWLFSFHLGGLPITKWPIMIRRACKTNRKQNGNKSAVELHCFFGGSTCRILVLQDHQPT